MESLNDILVVLVEPEHPGNIGAAARAMANMGLRHLVLVAPSEFPSSVASSRASGAPTLKNVSVAETLDEALQDCSLVVAASARTRAVSWPQRSPELAMQELLDARGKSALVFGRESTGLTNAELDRCHFQTRIPVDESFSSLNLGSAVSVLLYELRRQALRASTQVPSTKAELCTAAEMRGFHDHLARVVEKADAGGERSSSRSRILTRVFNRAALQGSEVRLLRGILTSIEAKFS